MSATSGDDRFDRDVSALKRAEADVLMRKQHDYGAANIAQAPGGPLNGLAVRLYDKVSRLANLAAHGEVTEAHFESLEDTMLDIANYGTIGQMVLKGMWPTIRADEAQAREPKAVVDADRFFDVGDRVMLDPGFTGEVNASGAGSPRPGATYKVKNGYPDVDGELLICDPDRPEHFYWAVPEALTFA